jgi:hypothetical protein
MTEQLQQVREVVGCKVVSRLYVFANSSQGCAAGLCSRSSPLESCHVKTVAFQSSSPVTTAKLTKTQRPCASNYRQDFRVCRQRLVSSNVLPRLGLCDRGTDETESRTRWAGGAQDMT